MDATSASVNVNRVLADATAKRREVLAARGVKRRMEAAPL